MDINVGVNRIDKIIRAFEKNQGLLQQSSPAFIGRQAPLGSLDIVESNILHTNNKNMVCSDNTDDTCKVSESFCGHQPVAENMMDKENKCTLVSRPLHKSCHVSPKVDRHRLLQNCEKKSPKANSSLNHNSISSNCTGAKRTWIKKEPFSEFYEVEEEIGRGKFAVVRRCRHIRSGMKRAAKFLRKRRKGRDCRSEVMKEVTMLEMASAHQRLVDLIEVYETSHEIILVMEFVEGGELFQKIMDEDSFEEEEAKRLLRQIVEAVFFLHEKNIVHLDIKPQNVLLTSPSRGNIKLCDLGFARPLHSGDDVRDIIGTPDYVAPEILSYEPIHLASDMWSVGVLTYVLLTGCAPFTGDDKQETFLNISQVNLDFPDELFGDISKEAVDFISRLLVHDPRQRLTARDCLHHPWLEQPQHPVVSESSPVRQRRALTPPSPDSLAEEPLKKCRCQASTPPPVQSVPLKVFDSFLNPASDNQLRHRLTFGGICSTSEKKDSDQNDQTSSITSSDTSLSASSFCAELSLELEICPSSTDQSLQIRGSVTDESCT